MGKNNGFEVIRIDTCLNILVMNFIKIFNTIDNLYIKNTILTFIKKQREFNIFYIKKYITPINNNNMLPQ